MMKTIKGVILVASSIVLGLISYPCCNAQVSCGGTITGTTINSDVVCTNDCVLDGVTISGSVICSTGSLLAKGGSSISGNVLISGAVTTFELADVTVLGDVDIRDAASLTEVVIQLAATVGPVSVLNTPAVITVSGSLSTLSLSNAGALFADKLTTVGGISIFSGVGDVQICGSFVGGGLSAQERNGDIKIDANAVNCEPSTLVGQFSATKGSGTIVVRGANLSAADFMVLEHTGDVTLSGAKVSDVKVMIVTGSLVLCDVRTDSDVIITEHVGNLDLKQLIIVGDFSITNVDGDVTLKDSNFNLEDVTIVLISNNLLVQNNTDLNLTVEQVSGSVDIVNNVLTVSSVNKNTGGVTITGNTIETLSCADNVPPPSGSGNTILFPVGQCAGL